jgi:hypothetical protein
VDVEGSNPFSRSIRLEAMTWWSSLLRNFRGFDAPALVRFARTLVRLCGLVQERSNPFSQALNEKMAAARIQPERPNLSERELRSRVTALWLDPELMTRALGWDPRFEHQ